MTPQEDWTERAVPKRVLLTGQALRKSLFPVNILLVFIPLSFVFDALDLSPLFVFVSGVLAITPLALLLSKSTEDLSAHTNPTAASLVNATSGNIIEIFVAFFALRAGLVDVVKASISGSILVNTLLLIGLSIFAGGLRYRSQSFNQAAAGVAASMLLVSVISVAIPTVYGLASDEPAPGLSLSVSVVMAVIYVLSLVFTFFTHSSVFMVERVAGPYTPRWNVRTAAAVLVVCTVAVGAESDLVVRTIEPVSEDLGLSHAFIGLVVIAILTNVAEKVAAVSYALRNQIDLSLSIGMNSAIQVALFAAPIVVIMGHILGQPMDLVFTPYEIVAMVASVIILNHMVPDGECQWLEGAQFLSVYAIIIMTFYFV